MRRSRCTGLGRSLVGAVAFVAFVVGCGGSGPALLDRAALLDSASCQTCHPSQYEEWSGSMHAYSSDDPVFLAMNRRGQRETDGALGTFCVNCHAPLAVREGLTTDGLNLDQVPGPMKSVGCYFCHAAQAVNGTHNNPLVLAGDNSLYGPFADPVPGTPHRAQYSTLFDDTHPDSAAACGSCHDIVNLRDAHVERTYQEWQGTLFAKPPLGLTCAACHMPGRDGPASSVSTRTRRLHSHAFPGVDLALTPFPQADVQRALVEAELSGVVQSTICYDQVARQFSVTLDNVGAGHAWPSGATPDRRAWVEVAAMLGDQVLYTSGGAAAAPIEASPDPDLWLMRDCLYDAAGNEVHMFWEPTVIESNQLPGAITASVSDPASFALTHVVTRYPGGETPLSQVPDRITVKVHVQAIGDAVLADLVASGDLDPAIPAGIARFELSGAALQWTVAGATPYTDQRTGVPMLCVTGGRYNPSTTPAKSHARCQP